jgi:uncharacterized protein (TIGR02145 family)
MKVLKSAFIFYFVISFGISNSSGQEYETVEIGIQVWMKRNLNIEADSSFCYKNLAENCSIFGRLYNWETALTVCPEGFRLPSDDDWSMLTETTGGLDVAGYRLMAGGDTDFDVLLGGNYNASSDIFSYQFRCAYFWTSTSFSETAAWMRHFENEKTNINRSTVKKQYYFSVRCIRN